MRYERAPVDLDAEAPAEPVADRGPDGAMDHAAEVGSGPALRALILIGGCAAATPALVAQAIGFAELDGSARGALLLASACATAVLIGGGIWAAGTRRSERGDAGREATAPACERSAPSPRGMTLHEALFARAPVASRKRPAIDALDPTAFYWALAREGDARTAETDGETRPGRTLEQALCAAPRRRASVSVASVSASGGLGNWSRRYAHARRSAEISRRRETMRRPAPALGPRLFEMAPGEGSVQGKQDKLVWAITQMSKGETARRHADEVSRGVRAPAEV